MNIGNMVSGKVRQRKVTVISDYFPKTVEQKIYCHKTIEDYITRNGWMEKIGLQLEEEPIDETNLEKETVKIEIRRTL